MSEHHDAVLSIASLQMAAVTRGGTVDGMIFHTGRGSEYSAARVQAACRYWGVVQSMGRVGCALDNVAAESFKSTLKVEYVHRHRFATRAEARLKIATGSPTSTTPAADTVPPTGYPRSSTSSRS